MKFITDVLQAIGSGFRNYFNFGGYATRMEFWSWMVFQFICLLLVSFIEYEFGTGDYIEGVWRRNFGPEHEHSALTHLSLTATLIPSLSVISRRLRASGRNPAYLWTWYSILVLSGVIYYYITTQDVYFKYPARYVLYLIFARFNLITHIIGWIDILRFIMSDTFDWSFARSFLGFWSYIVLHITGTSVMVWTIIFTWRNVPQLNEVGESGSNTFSDEPLPTTKPTSQSPVEPLEAEVVPEKPRLSRTCTKCGVTSPSEATHCILCRTKLPSIICPKCQTENISRAKFCISCGEER